MIGDIPRFLDITRSVASTLDSLIHFFRRVLADKTRLDATCLQKLIKLHYSTK